EILDYLRHCASKYDINRHIRLNTEVTAAEWQEQQQHWRISLNDGTHVTARALITATGQLNQPAYPPLQGIDAFHGTHFHSARWDHSVDLRGKTVAVLGTGASAIQFVPEVAKVAGKLMLFQRSAAYVISKPDRAYSKLEHRILEKWPLTHTLDRARIYAANEARVLGFTSFQKAMELYKWLF